jgi:imidazole glycerol phosphate synthase subunit HisF
VTVRVRVIPCLDVSNGRVVKGVLNADASALIALMAQGCGKFSMVTCQ